MRSCCLLMLLLPIAAPATASEALLEHTDVYQSGEDGYQIYRIPGIETAPDGTLLAFAEARKYGGSIRASTSRTSTWS